MADNHPHVVSNPEFPPNPPELSDSDIDLIHARLMIASQKATVSMAREIKKWRHPDKNPDLI